MKDARLRSTGLTVGFVRFTSGETVVALDESAAG